MRVGVANCSSLSRRTPGSGESNFSAPALTVKAPALCSTIARSIGHDANAATCSFRQPVRRLQEFQHGAIRILRRQVALDHIVKGAADQELRVAWIRKQVAIGDMDAAAQGRIARDGAMLAHQRAPEERQQLLASRLRRRRPISLVELVVLEPLSRLQLRSQDGGVHAKKHLLDARAIEREQHDRRRRLGKHSRHQPRSKPASDRARRIFTWRF